MSNCYNKSLSFKSQLQKSAMSNLSEFNFNSFYTKSIIDQGIYANHKVHITFKSFIIFLFNSNAFKWMDIFITLFSLYSNDIKLLFTDRTADSSFNVITIFLMIFFLCEILFLFLWDKEYGCSLFFWTDLFGTLSLLLDIDVINDAIQEAFSGINEEKIDNKTLTLVRFSKGIRAFRIIRLVKMAKIFARKSKLNEKKDEPQSDDKTEGNEDKLSEKFEDLIVRRMVFLLLAMLIVLYLLNPELYAKQLSRHESEIQIFDYLFPKYMLYFNISYDIYINEFKDNTDTPLIFSSIFGRKYLNENFNAKLRKFEKSLVLDFCDKLKLKDVNNDTYNTNDTFNVTHYNYLVSQEILPNLNLEDDICVAIFDNRNFSRKSSLFSLIKTSVVLIIFSSGFVLIENDMKNIVIDPIDKMIKKIKNISKNPIASLQADQGDQNGNIISEKEHKKHNATSLSTTTTSVSTSTKKCECISQSKMFETTILEKKLNKICALLVLGFGEAGAEIISSVLQEGLDVEMNPVIPGKKVVGIYGFCDIRNFTDTTDVLQEKVMIFVNQVAEIVHEIVSDYCGTANKNIGDAFLLVWKFEEKFIDFSISEPKLRKCDEVSRIVDMALISFLSIIMTVQKSKKLNEYRKHKALNERMKNYSVKLGFGLHLGYSIEGAIGSMFKIDASYLSPNVDMSNKLEEKTKDYGKELIISGQFVDYLGESAKKYVRLLDQVKSASGEKNKYYTVDMNLTALNVMSSQTNADDENPTVKMEKVLQKKRRSKNLYKTVLKGKVDPWGLFENTKDFKKVRNGYDGEFMKMYNKGMNAYINGKWKEAKEYFESANVSVFYLFIIYI